MHTGIREARVFFFFSGFYDVRHGMHWAMCLCCQIKSVASWLRWNERMKKTHTGCPVHPNRISEMGSMWRMHNANASHIACTATHCQHRTSVQPIAKYCIGRRTTHKGVGNKNTNMPNFWRQRNMYTKYDKLFVQESHKYSKRSYNFT